MPKKKKVMKPATDKLEPVLVPDPDDPETGQVVRGVRMETRGGNRTGVIVPLTAPPFSIFIKYPDGYRYYCQVAEVPSEATLRAHIPWLAQKGGRIKITDQGTGKAYLPVDPEVPTTQPPTGVGWPMPPAAPVNPTTTPPSWNQLPPVYLPPPQPVTPSAPTDWVGVMAAMTPLLLGFFKLLRQPPVPPAGSLTDQITALKGLRELASDLNPGSSDDDGMATAFATLLPALLGGAQPPPAPPGLPYPPQGAPPAAQVPPSWPPPAAQVPPSWPPPAAQVPPSWPVPPEPPPVQLVPETEETPSSESAAALEAIQALCAANNIDFESTRLWLIGASESEDPADWLRWAQENGPWASQLSETPEGVPS